MVAAAHTPGVVKLRWEDLQRRSSMRQPIRITVMGVPATMVPCRSVLGFYVVNDDNIWRTSERLAQFREWADAGLVKSV